jgi:hypothetical protein
VENLQGDDYVLVTSQSVFSVYKNNGWIEMMGARGCMYECTRRRLYVICYSCRYASCEAAVYASFFVFSWNVDQRAVTRGVDNYR